MKTLSIILLCLTITGSCFATTSNTTTVNGSNLSNTLIVEKNHYLKQERQHKVIPLPKSLSRQQNNTGQLVDGSSQTMRSEINRHNLQLNSGRPYRYAQPIKIKKRKKYKKASTVYSNYRKNIISDSQITTVIFPAAITEAIIPNGNLVPLPNPSAQGQVTPIIYSKDRKKISFQLRNTGKAATQFTVFLSNGKVLALHFILADVPGVVIRVPQSIAGLDTSDNKNPIKAVSSEAYDHSLVNQLSNLSDQFQSNHQLNDAWMLVHHSHRNLSPYKQFYTKKYFEWKSDDEVFQAWSLCNKESHSISLTGSEFVQGVNTLAVQLSKQYLLPNQCGWLYALSEAGQHSNSNNQHMLKPE